MEMYRLFIGAAILALANGRSLSIFEPLIMDGQITSIENVPYLVSLEYLETHTGGGVILSKNKILTAARCVPSSSRDDVNANPKHFRVRAGTTVLEQGGQLIPVLAGILHPYYNPDFHDFDVAIFELTKPIVFGAVAKPIALASKEAVNNDLVTVSGWGISDPVFEDYYRDSKLRSAEISVISKDECDQTLGTYIDGTLSENMFCAGGYGRGVYKRDYGGPAVNQDNKLVGIAIFAPIMKAETYPQLYTNVLSPPIREFIDRHMK